MVQDSKDTGLESNLALNFFSILVLQQPFGMRIDFLESDHDFQRAIFQVHGITYSFS